MNKGKEQIGKTDSSAITVMSSATGIRIPIGVVPNLKKVVLGARTAIYNGITGVYTKSSRQARETEQKRELSPEEMEELISIIKSRFDAPPSHYYGTMKDLKETVTWAVIEKSLRNANPALLWSLNELEKADGHVDLMADKEGFLYFGDCAQRAPVEHKNNRHKKAVEQAEPLGVEMVDDDFWLRQLQKLGKFDNDERCLLKTDDNHLNQGLVLVGRYSDYSSQSTKEGANVTSVPDGGDSASAWRGFVKIPKLTD